MKNKYLHLIFAVCVAGTLRTAHPCDCALTVSCCATGGPETRAPICEHGKGPAKSAPSENCCANCRIEQAAIIVKDAMAPEFFQRKHIFPTHEFSSKATSSLPEFSEAGTVFCDSPPGLFVRYILGTTLFLRAPPQNPLL